MTSQAPDGRGERRHDHPGKTARRFRSLRGCSGWLALVCLSVFALVWHAPTSTFTELGPAASPAVESAEGPRVLLVRPGRGDSGTGTARNPFRSLARALSALEPGDTLLVGEGRYRERVDLRVTPARPDRRTSVRAAPGARPVVEGLVWLHGADHWDVSGLHVTWSRENVRDEHMVKFDGGRGWTFTDSELSFARSFAALLVTGGAREFRLARLYVHDTRPSNGENQDHLIYVNTYGAGAVIERCLLIGSRNGRGIKVGPPGRRGKAVGGLQIRYNTFVDNRGPSNVQLSYTASDVEIHRNIMVRPDDGSANVTAYRLRGRNNSVHDNLVHGSTGAVAEVEGLVDTGGNVVADPDFVAPEVGDFRPRAEAALRYGRHGQDDEP